MQRKLMFLFVLVPVICFSQTKSKSPEIIEMVCKGSEQNAISALLTLSGRTNNKDLTLEKIRSSYAESMHDERERMKSFLNTPTFDILLDSASETFKYSLCQKLQRPSTSVSTISSEVYFFCRKTITTGIDQKPAPCF